MPIYEYRCTNCHHLFEHIQKVNEQSAVHCPQCSQNTTEKLISAPGFQLKGTGWYATDFKNPSKPTQVTETPSTPSKADKSGSE